jgi:hypothetical protein
MTLYGMFGGQRPAGGTAGSAGSAGVPAGGNTGIIGGAAVDLYGIFVGGSSS